VQAITNKRIEEILTPAVGEANRHSQAQQQLRRKSDKIEKQTKHSFTKLIYIHLKKKYA